MSPRVAGNSARVYFRAKNALRLGFNPVQVGPDGSVFGTSPREPKRLMLARSSLGILIVAGPLSIGGHRFRQRRQNFVPLRSTHENKPHLAGWPREKNNKTKQRRAFIIHRGLRRLRCACDGVAATRGCSRGESLRREKTFCI